MQFRTQNPRNEKIYENNETNSHGLIQYHTELLKARDGWHASSKHKLADTPDGAHVLKVSTCKTRPGTITTFASVRIRKPTETLGITTETYALFEDYARTFAVVPCSRTTKNAIEKAHLSALGSMPQIVGEAEAHYAAKKAA